MSFAENIKELVTCPICFEIFESPKMLKCMHTFCGACTDNLIACNKIECPQCREFTHKKEIRKDFNKQNLLDMYNITVTSQTDENSHKCIACETCEKDSQEKDTYKCHECNMFICTACKKVHNSFPAISDHSIDAVEELTRLAKDHLHITSQKLQDLRQQLEDSKKSYDGAVANAKAVAIKKTNENRKLLKAKIDGHHDKILSEINNISVPACVNETEMGINTIRSTLANIDDLMKSSSMKQVLDLSESITTEANQVLAGTDVRQHTVNVPEVVVQPVDFEYDTVIQVRITSVPAYMEPLKDAAENNPDKRMDSTTVEGTNFTGIDKTTETISLDQSAEKLLSIAERQKLYKKVKEIEMGFSLQRVRYVDDSIWCVGDKTLRIYNNDLDLVKEFKLDPITQAISAVKTQIGTAMIACQNGCGLHELNLTTCKLTEVIKHGGFGDVATIGNHAFALAPAKCKIFVLKLNSGEEWAQINRFSISAKSGYFDTILVNSLFVFVCIWRESVVTKYSYDGTLLEKYELFPSPRVSKELRTKLCDVDNGGNMLLSDYKKHSFLLISGATGESETISLKQLTVNPIDCCSDESGRNLWILTRRQTERRTLVKFTCE